MYVCTGFKTNCIRPLSERRRHVLRSARRPKRVRDTRKQTSHVGTHSCQRSSSSKNLVPRLCFDLELTLPVGVAAFRVVLPPPLPHRPSDADEDSPTRRYPTPSPATPTPPTPPPSLPPSPSPSPAPSPPSATPWVAPASSAYGGVPADIPGPIEAERFDHGGEGVGYSDITPGNAGGVSEGVTELKVGSVGEGVMERRSDVEGGCVTWHVARPCVPLFLRRFACSTRCLPSRKTVFHVVESLLLPSFSGKYHVLVAACRACRGHWENGCVVVD